MRILIALFTSCFLFTACGGDEAILTAGTGNAELDGAIADAWGKWLYYLFYRVDIELVDIIS